MFLCVFYYSVMLFSIVWYLMILKYRFRDGIWSFCSLTYFISIPFVMIPGFFIANHSLTYFNAYIDINSIFTNDVDYTIYFLYIFFMLIPSIGLSLGQSLGENYVLKLELRHNYVKRTKTAMLLILIYAICYFLWIPEVPLLKLFTTDHISAVTARLSITHGLASLAPPLLFRYWRNVLWLFSLSLVLYFLTTKHNLVFKIVIFLVQSWFMVFTLEKSGFMYFMLSLICTILYISKFRHKNNLIKLFFLMFFLILGLVAMYAVFLKQSSPISSILARIFQQTAVLPFEIEYVRQHGFLGIKNIPMHLLDDLIGLHIVDVSKMAIIELFPQYNTLELSGAAGGLSIANLYMSFGWSSVLLFFIYTYFVGFIDRIIFKSIGLKNAQERIFLISTYYAFALINLFSLISSVFGLFSLTLILNPQVWLFLCFMSLFIKYKFKIYRLKSAILRV